MAPLIVIEGIDGVGKATQTRMLADTLANIGHAIETFEFPAYKENFFGRMLGDLLSGKRGNFVHANPYLASLPYMLDRLESAKRVRSALEADFIVLCDRYSGSNQIHQGGKIKDENERAAFLAWLHEAEHQVIGNPMPSMVIYLDAPVDVSLKLLAQKRAAKGQHMREGDLDQVERDREYLENSHDMARWIAARDSQWYLIDCTDTQGSMRSRASIHTDVLRAVSEVLELD